MALVLTVTDHWTDGKRVHVIGTIVASGNYTTGGDTLALNDSEIKSNSLPEFVIIQSKSGAYFYKLQPGTTRANSLLIVLSLATQAEIPGAPTAYPAGVTGDTISFYGIFPKFI